VTQEDRKVAREQDGDQTRVEVTPGGTEGGRRPTGVPPGGAGVKDLLPGTFHVIPTHSSLRKEFSANAITVRPPENPNAGAAPPGINTTGAALLIPQAECGLDRTRISLNLSEGFIVPVQRDLLRKICSRIGRFWQTILY
jgi:hypothetical protein